MCSDIHVFFLNFLLMNLFFFSYLNTKISDDSCHLQPALDAPDHWSKTWQQSTLTNVVY